jgi:hypothetical protein
MPVPEWFLRYEINPAFLPLSETDREGAAWTLEEVATLLLARACEIRKGEPHGAAVEVAWPT